MAFFPRQEDLALIGIPQAVLHEQAASQTRNRFGKQVFVRAVVEVSNYCRENCHYCGMRRDNRNLNRARADFAEIANLLIHHRPTAATDINIQTGEDPVAVTEVVLPLIRILRRETQLGISVCLGTLDRDIYQELKAAGASIYVLKFETANPDDYKAIQAPGSLAERVEHIRWLAGQGWHVSSGFIAGLPGQRQEQLMENFQLAGSLPLHGCSVSPFVAGENTPLAETQTSDLETSLNCMAALRLMRPDWIIPAVSALNLAGGEQGNGYRRGLRAGANLVTINMTPRPHQEDYVIYKRNRFIMDETRISEALAAENLTPAKQSLAQFYQRQSRAGMPHLELVGEDRG